MAEEVIKFENMILAEGARLKERGEKGLEILPGVQELLAPVSTKGERSEFESSERV